MLFRAFKKFKTIFEQEGRRRTKQNGGKILSAE